MIVTYTPSKRVVLGLEPSSGHEPFFGAVRSVSSTRMDTLFHDWRDQAVGANLYWQRGDTVGHLEQILHETRCEIVVALGIFAAEHLGIHEPKLLEEYDVEYGGVPLHVLAFPHPSGLNRYWNSVDNRILAADALKKTLLS